jgi:hypothetical protein
VSAPDPLWAAVEAACSAPSAYQLPEDASPFDWTDAIALEVRETEEAMGDPALGAEEQTDAYRRGLTQIAAMALRALRHLDRRVTAGAPPFRDMTDEEARALLGKDDDALA